MQVMHRALHPGAKADYSQPNFDVAGAIDDSTKTAWAIAPKFHAAHWAIFETAEPLGFAGGTRLTVTLQQNFGAGRTIGRLRLTALVVDADDAGELAADFEANAFVGAGDEDIHVGKVKEEIEKGKRGAFQFLTKASWGESRHGQGRG